jgi:acetyl esterase/lipase
MKQISRRGLIQSSSLVALSTLVGGCATPRSAAFQAPSPSNIDPMSLIHPELRPTVEMFAKMIAKQPPLSNETLSALRAPISFNLPSAPEIPVVERYIPGRAGAPEVRVHVVNAKPGERRPGILSMHGGGYVGGTAASDAQMSTITAKALDCCVVSVDYRLAPETNWEGSVEDNYAALKWLYDNADDLGVDRVRLAVMGGSAGGGHAALLAIRARDRGEIPLVLQCLTAPMLDDRTGSTRAVASHLGTFLWTASSNRFGWKSFLGMDPGGRDVPAAAVPARTVSVAGLAPAFIGVGSVDLFLEEDIEYARRLMVAGVATELVVVPGAPHGFDIIESASITRQFLGARLNSLRRAFNIPIAG